MSSATNRSMGNCPTIPAGSPAAAERKSGMFDTATFTASDANDAAADGTAGPFCVVSRKIGLRDACCVAGSASPAMTPRTFGM